MGRLISFLYGLISYAVFLVTFLYAICFVGDLPVPKTLASGGEPAGLAASAMVELPGADERFSRSSTA